MIKLNRHFILLLLVIFSSCNSSTMHSGDTYWKATRAEEEMAFKNAKFKSKVLQNMDKYDSLKDLLLSNLDTIFKYHYSKDTNGRVYVDHNRKDIAGDTCWYFSTEFDTSDFPDFLRLKLEALTQEMYPNLLSSCTFCKDSALTFYINNDEPIDTVALIVSHVLLWKYDKPDDRKNDFYKDTILQRKWRYYIGVSINDSD